jgi:hypothetical protein
MKTELSKMAVLLAFVVGCSGGGGGGDFGTDTETDADTGGEDYADYYTVDGVAPGDCEATYHEYKGILPELMVSFCDFEGGERWNFVPTEEPGVATETGCKWPVSYKERCAAPCELSELGLQNDLIIWSCP